MLFDFFGREIHPGATLVYAALVGRSAVLKSGQLIATDSQRITVEIESDKRTGDGYITVRRRVILTFPERCAVVFV